MVKEFEFTEEMVIYIFELSPWDEYYFILNMFLSPF